MKTKYAVLVTLESDDNGMLLSLYDAVKASEEVSTNWKQDRIITSKKYANENIEDLNLPDKELADMAHYILARLRAVRKVNKEA